MSIKDVIKRGRELIATHGWMVQGVGAGEDDPSFTYSIGASFASRVFPGRVDHPEIVIVGFDMGLCSGLINQVLSAVRDGEARFDVPMVSPDVLEGYDVAFRPVLSSSAEQHLFQVRNYSPDEGVDCVQLFLPDKNNLFPWDKGCSKVLAELQAGLLEWTPDLPYRPAADIRRGTPPGTPRDRTKPR